MIIEKNITNSENNNLLIEEAKRLTKEYAIKNNCYATFDTENEFFGFRGDNWIHEVINYRFYARPRLGDADTGHTKRLTIENGNLETLIQKMKELL